jgi:phage-related minor tail protein
MADELYKLTLETEALKVQMLDLDKLAQSFGNRLVTSFAGAVIHGRNLSDVLRGLALSLANTALSQGLRPLGNLVGGLLGNVLGSANGNVFQAGRIVPFADGGIVNSPTLFPMRGATGLMGEAGPEAVMPLARGQDGKLGVRGAGGGVNVTVNTSTPDAQSFDRSQSQVAALIARAVSRGQRNL